MLNRDMMNRAAILGRIHLFLAECREIVVLPIPREETDEARLEREAKQAQLDADYLDWQMSPEEPPVDVADNRPVLGQLRLAA